jgi:hypothetical protein
MAEHEFGKGIAPIGLLALLLFSWEFFKFVIIVTYNAFSVAKRFVEMRMMRCDVGGFCEIQQGFYGKCFPRSVLISPPHMTYVQVGMERSVIGNRTPKRTLCYTTVRNVEEQIGQCGIIKTVNIWRETKRMVTP